MQIKKNLNIYAYDWVDISRWNFSDDDISWINLLYKWLRAAMLIKHKSGITISLNSTSH